MSGRYSDQLPSFKGEEPEEERGFARFAPWVKSGFAEGGRREPRPFVQMAAFLVMIVCLGYGLSRPFELKRALLAEDHPRIALPIGLSAGDNPDWNEENVRSSIEEVRPPAALCLQGWSDLQTNDNGSVIAEVVLTPEGPEEAALYDQDSAIPEPVGACLANALGSVSWPLPSTEQAVTFPIVGGP